MVTSCGSTRCRPETPMSTPPSQLAEDGGLAEALRDLAEQFRGDEDRDEREQETRRCTWQDSDVERSFTRRPSCRAHEEAREATPSSKPVRAFFTKRAVVVVAVRLVEEGVDRVMGLRRRRGLRRVSALERLCSASADCSAAWTSEVRMNSRSSAMAVMSARTSASLQRMASTFGTSASAIVRARGRRWRRRRRDRSCARRRARAGATSGSSSSRDCGETRPMSRRSMAQCCGDHAGSPARSGQPRCWRHSLSLRSWWQL